MSWQQRDYQQRAHDAAFHEWDERGVMSTLINMPTGTGKTRVATKIATTVVHDYEMRVLFLAHREILVRQAAATLASSGLDTEVEMAIENADLESQVIVATVQTLQGKRLASWPSNHFGLIITDEAHHGHAKGYENIRRHFPFARHLGITATPEAGKKPIFESEAFRYTMTQAVKDGWLVPISEWQRCRTGVNLRNITVTAGDFSLGDLGERISAHVEPLANTFARQIGGRKTVIFTPDVGSAQAMAAALRTKTAAKRAVDARYVAGAGGQFGMSKGERKQILHDFDVNKFQAIVCCELLIEGWDCPDVSCVGIARPTLQLYRAKQMVGRGTRIHPKSGKKDLLVVDFDWRADRRTRDLITPVDFVAADDPQFQELDAEIRQKILWNARKKWASGTEAALALELAKKYQRKRANVPVFMRGTDTHCDVHAHDPLGVGEVADFRHENWDVSRANMATEKQVSLLHRLGIKNTENMTKNRASELIGKILDRRR